MAAAHQVLVTYSPTARATLDAAYAASLNGIQDGRSKTAGIRYGIRVADNLIAARANNGRDAPVYFTQPRRRVSGGPLRPCSDVVNGRMWLGVHFRSADEVGSRMGQRIGDWALDHYFQPVRHH